MKTYLKKAVHLLVAMAFVFASIPQALAQNVEYATTASAAQLAEMSFQTPGPSYPAYMAGLIPHVIPDPMAHIRIPMAGHPHRDKSLYSYAGANPINYYDPEGTLVNPIVAAIVLLGAAAVFVVTGYMQAATPHNNLFPPDPNPKPQPGGTCPLNRWENDEDQEAPEPVEIPGEGMPVGR